MLNELKRGRKTSPCCKSGWLWHQIHGMRMVREVVPKKPKKPYYVYDVQCDKCGEQYTIRK